MGLLEHLGIVERAQQAAADRQRCVRCGHLHLASNLATVVDAPYPYVPGGPATTTVLVCAAGCPDPVGVHPALPRRLGVSPWAWQGSCEAPATQVAPEPARQPEWLRRAQSGTLPAKEF